MSSDPSPVRKTWTILQLLKWTADYLRRHGIEQPRSDAELLLSHTLACQRIDLYLRYDQPLVDEELKRFKDLIKRRATRCPTAYILGHKEFWSLNFSVSSDVLIPRPETECLVEGVLKTHGADKPLDVLELGTGSGAIAIALASERPNWTIRATDISPQALDMAKINASRHGVEARIEFISGRWFEPLAGSHPTFDLIVSNPPYIASGDLAGLAPEIGEHEPITALDGGRQGLACIDHIINTSPQYMAPGGELVLEIGSEQGVAVERLGLECGAFDRISISRDYGGLDRVARLILKGDLRPR